MTDRIPDSAVQEALFAFHWPAAIPGATQEYWHERMREALEASGAVFLTEGQVVVSEAELDRQRTDLDVAQEANRHLLPENQRLEAELVRLKASGAAFLTDEETCNKLRAIARRDGTDTAADLAPYIALSPDTWDEDDPGRSNMADEEIAARWEYDGGEDD